VEQNTVVQEISLPLYEVKGWIKFLGIFNIVQGGLTALTIVGIIFAWLPIWTGILLYQLAQRIENARYSGDQGQFFDGMQKIKTIVIIYSVLTLLGIAAMIFVFVVWGAIFFAALSEYGS
jgi:hypothetical protein